MHSIAMYKRLLWGLFAVSNSVVFLAGAGCIPISGEYYKPHAAVGQVVSYAGAGCGPEDTLKLDRLNVLIWITYLGKYNNNQKSPFGIRLDFRIPQDKSLNLNLNDFKVLSESGDAFKISGVYVASTTPGLRVQRIDSMKGNVVLSGSEHISPKVHYSEYWINVDFTGFISSKFTFVIPAMEISGSLFPKENVLFGKTGGTWTAGISCP